MKPGKGKFLDKLSIEGIICNKIGIPIKNKPVFANGFILNNKYVSIKFKMPETI